MGNFFAAPASQLVMPSWRHHGYSVQAITAKLYIRAFYLGEMAGRATAQGVQGVNHQNCYFTGFWSNKIQIFNFKDRGEPPFRRK